VQTIKVADIISNTRDIVREDPGFARTYIEENALILSRLTRANPALRQQAEAIVAEGRRQLRQGPRHAPPA